MFVSLRPCLSCLKLALAAGVRRLIYSRGWVYTNEQVEAAYARTASNLVEFRSGDRE
jgi:deoxycytidylate deaminase